MAEEEQNKSEQASQFKLEQAKKKGSVAKSLDINSGAMLLVLILTLLFFGRHLVQEQLHLSRYVFSQAGHLVFSPRQMVAWCNQLLIASLSIGLPLFLLIMLSGILSNLCQTGPVFSTFPLKPDFKKLNPATGLKRLFSMKLLVESLKSIFKIIALTFVLYFFIRHALPLLFGLPQADAQIYPKVVLQQVIRVLAWCWLALLPVFLLDLIYVRRDFLKKMMMSRREVKDEYKQREGDPRIRAKLRELQKEARQRSKSLRNVKDADVLITNPTHLAVAIRYERTRMAAPLVVAKGAGQLAQLMREMARRHQVPVVENRRLARELFRTASLAAPLPEALYPAIARVLSWVYAQCAAKQQLRSSRAARAPLPSYPSPIPTQHV